MLARRFNHAVAVVITLCSVTTFLPAAPAFSVKQESTITENAPVTEYTGVIIDLRAFPKADRSPSPAIFGPRPEERLLYPDRANVPTPDEVQQQSIVRYYDNEEAAKKGIAGNTPLMIKAAALVGAANDSVELSAEDMARFLEADKKSHFTRTWKVAFLLPEGR